MKVNSFKFKFFQTEIVGLGFGVPVASAYVLLLLDVSGDDVSRILRAVAVMAAVIVIGIALPVNYMLIRRISKLMGPFYTDNIGKDDAEELYLRVMRLPVKHALLLFSRISAGALIIIGYMFFILHIEGIKCAMAVILSLYGSYLAAIIASMAASSITRPVGRDIVGKGLLSRDFIDSRKIFGLGVIRRNVIMLAVPIILTNITVFFSFFSAHISETPMQNLIPRISGVLLANTLTLLVLFGLSLLMLKQPLKLLQKTLSGLADSDGGEQSLIPTDLFDDFAYISYLMNLAVKNFSLVLDEAERAAGMLSGAVRELSRTSADVSLTSNQQAAAVKEIVSTMEDSDKLSKSIADSIHGVSGISRQTREAVESGVKRVGSSLIKMDEIRNSNAKNIEDIRELGEKIGSIWEIVNIINSIANQTRIIAFNAELEASAAGEAGKNFQIVATEIRRLADSTVASTAEIRNRITEIQHSSDEVIRVSEEGTVIIEEGRELSRQLNSVFGEIMDSAENTARSAGEIEGSVNQQVSAFEQILATLRQISDGIDSFVVSTKASSASSEQLKDMAESLNRLVGSRASLKTGERKNND